MTTKMIVKLRRFLHEGFYSFSFAVGQTACFQRSTLHALRLTCFSVLLLSASAQESSLTVDNLTVTKDASVYGQLNVGFPEITNGSVAFGGAMTTSGSYRIHTFTNAGTSSFTVLGEPLVCEVLVVAGGGGGACGNDGVASGGGAGGVMYINEFLVSGENTVIVGQGGAGGYFAPGYAVGQNGSNSVFSTLIAIGGGHGSKFGTYEQQAGNGGSGGGACGVNMRTPGKGTAGQGHDGGEGYAGPESYDSGGGGGAGEPGHAGTSSAAGNGGAGIACSISGTEKYYGGGGGAGVWSGGPDTPGSGGIGGGGDGAKSTDGENGEPNTGGGGGGEGMVSTTNVGGAGGSGIVIVRYPITSVGYVSTLSISSNGISQTSVSATNVFMGKVGIGTETPEEKLHVSDNVRIDGALTFGGETRTNWPIGGGVAEGALMASSNLADLADAAAARTNLGLGSAAIEDALAFDAAGTAAAVSSALATHTGNFNNPHKVTAEQVGAVSTNAGALLAANNLSELSATAATARSNLGLGSAAIKEASAFLSTDGGNVNGNVSVSGSVSVDAPSGDIPMGVYTNQ